MPARRPIRIAVALVALALPCAGVCGEADASAAEESRTLVIVGDDGQRISVDYHDGELSVIRDGDGHTSVRVVDVDQVGRLVTQGLEEALAALRDAQLDFHMGSDNRIAFSHGSETVEVDVSAILAEVGAALEAGFAEFDDEDLVVTRERDRTEEELRRELRDLKRQMRELRRDLDRLSR